MMAMKRLIYFLLSILGFAGVSCEEQEQEQVCMYGVPTAKYELKARVVDSEGNPIKGIEVVVTPEEQENEWNRVLETTTKEDGTFENSRTRNSMITTKLYVKLTDVDGEENGGEFRELTQEVNVYHSPAYKIEDDDSWYSGCYKVIVGDIKLEPKSTELNGSENE